MNRYTVLHMKEISNKDLQNNTGNDIQYPAITYTGNQSETILDMENSIIFVVHLKLTQCGYSTLLPKPRVLVLTSKQVNK